MIFGTVPSPRRLLGRDTERALLAGLAGDLQAGGGAIVSLEGSAGIGKTALLAEFARLVSASGPAVVWSRATEVDSIRPFGCLIDTLECRLNHPDAMHRRVAEATVSIASGATDPFRFDSDAAWRFPVQDATCDLILGLVDKGPVLLVVDDVQWADAGTLGVLLALARRCATLPLMIAWTVRDNYRVDPILQIVGRYPENLHQVVLGPLEASHARQLGESLVGSPLESDALSRLDDAAGNPFFITALVSNGGSAATVTDAVANWVARLPGPTAELLAVASVIGSEFNTTLLSAMTDCPAGELLATLEPAVQLGLIRASGAGRYDFGHDLIRSSVEDALPASLSKALHRDAARIHSELDDDPGIVARHLAKGARFGDEAAAEQIRSACLQVVRHDANGAAALLASGIELCVPGSPVWAASIADRIITLQWAGRPDDALALAEASVTQPMPKESEVAVRIARATSLGLVNDLPGAAAEYRSLIDDDGIAPGLRALILAELSMLDSWGVDRAQGYTNAQRALELAREVGMLQAELQALCSLSTMQLFDGDVHDAVASAREAVTRGRRFRGLTPAREIYLGLALGNADEPDEAEIWLQAGQSVAQSVSDLWLVSRYRLARLTLGLNNGDWDSTVADADAVIDLHHETGLASGMPQSPAIAGIVALRRGASDEVIGRYRDLAVATATAGAEPAGLLFFGWFESLHAERGGDTTTALATLRFVYDAVAAMAPLVQMWLAPDLVRMLLAADQTDQVATITATLAEFAEKVGTASARGTAAWCAAQFADFRDDPELPAMLDTAVRLLREGRRLPLLGLALDRLIEIAPTRDSLAEAAGIRTRLGTPGRIAPDVPVPDGRDRVPGGPGRSRGAGRAGRADPFVSLTPAERVVAELVVEGLTNQQIASRLELSKRTVEFHVSHVYLKLGVTTRTALAALAR